jgi:hypothetical protein
VYLGDIGLVVLCIGIQDVEISRETCLVVGLYQMQSLICGSERFLHSLCNERYAKAEMRGGNSGRSNAGANDKYIRDEFNSSPVGL